MNNAISTMNCDRGTHVNDTVLISGASIAGPTLAYWLNRCGFRPTVVEKASTVRPGGYPIDLRGVAVEVMDRMGLLPQVRAAHVATRRATCVDSRGRQTARLELADMSGTGHDVELPRSRLASLLYDATREDVEYMFEDSISGLEQTEDGVRVTFRSGARRTFGLVVGADGLHSNVRGLTFGAEAQFHRHLGYYFVGFSVDADFGLDSEIVAHNRPGRVATLYAVRNQRRPNALLAFAVKERIDRRLSALEQLELVERTFAGDGWEVPRLLAAMRTADDLFFDSVSQIRMSCWTKGRVALVGDAGYAPSFLSGQGSSLAVVGAYQLAAALAGAGGDHRVAFPAYERSMRHFVEQNQQLALKASGAGIPRTTAGLWLRNWMLGIVPRLLPLLRWLKLPLDASIQRAANSLTLAALPTPLSARHVPAEV
jgi:2-polyprenyl-6-methoxyphenol hydroxylase-like FAD-dependent oxidoreductase